MLQPTRVKRIGHVAFGAAAVTLALAGTMGSAQAKHKHHNFGIVLDVGVPYHYGRPHYYGRSCWWLKEKAIYTGSRYWWRRYYNCIQY
jgi:hypothetical protein